MRPDDHDWFRETGREWRPLKAILTQSSCARIRPFDIEYLTATWLLERAEATGVRVFNRPRALRDHSEKLAITEFPQFTPETLIARDAAQLQQFIDEQRDDASSSRSTAWAAARFSASAATTRTAMSSSRR
jgi:glutathione synthase